MFRNAMHINTHSSKDIKTIKIIILKRNCTQTAHPMPEVLGWFMGSAVFYFSEPRENKKTKEPKKTYSESLGWDPPSRESGNIVFF